MNEPAQHDVNPPSVSADRYVRIPRWIVYFQATALAVTAATFFVFGLMVGSYEQRDSNAATDFVTHRIAGTVFVDSVKPINSDSGSVVLLLPTMPAAIERHSPATVRPDQFEPLENPTIDWIRSQQGEVIRANVNGEFEIFACDGTYDLVIISKRRQLAEPAKLSKEQIAALSQYFIPFETLIQRQAFHWQSIKVAGRPIEIDAITF